MSDSEFVKLLIESTESNKFFDSVIIPIEIKEMYCQMNNNSVKKYLRCHSLKVIEYMHTIKLILSCVGNILESQGSHPTYVEIFKNYNVHIYFNDFLIQSARNSPLIPENNPMKLPLKIAFGVLHDLLNVFFNKKITMQTQEDIELFKQKSEALRKNHLNTIIKSLDNVDLDKIENVAKTADVLSTIFNIPEIKSELENEKIYELNSNINNITENENENIIINPDNRVIDENIIDNHDGRFENVNSNDDDAGGGDDDDDEKSNKAFLLQLNNEVKFDTNNTLVFDSQSIVSPQSLSPPLPQPLSAPIFEYNNNKNNAIETNQHSVPKDVNTFNSNSFDFSADNIIFA